MEDGIVRSLPGIRFVSALPGGTYGLAFVGEHAARRKRVVVHILTAKWARPKDTVLQALHAHADVLKKLQIPNALPIVEVGCQNGQIFWVTDWAVGRPLPMPSGRVGVSAALAAARLLIGALFRAHEAGIGHFALRPSQVLLDLRRFREPQLGLHGLGLAAILSPPSDAFSAPARVYLAPERRDAAAGFSQGSLAADVYSLAMIIRALFDLHGEPAKTRSSSGGMPTALFALLSDMLAVQPAARPTLAQVSERFSQIVGSAGKKGEPAIANDPTVMAPSVSEPTAAPNHDPFLGQLFGSFRLKRRLGEGAMGLVYEAAHVRIGHRAAVKVLHPQFAESSEFARRFLDEAKAVNIVEHQGIVSIFDFGQRPDGSLYIVMEYLRGRTLESLLAVHPQGLGIEQALDLLEQLSSALATAHQKGIVHRDIKPSNLMLVADPLVAGSFRLKILDFGIAKLGTMQKESDAAGLRKDDTTEYGQVLGTPMYMAPEQYGAASEVTGEADVFAVGAVFFEMLTGNPPFGETASFRVVSEAAPRARSVRADIPLAMDELIASMLSAKPESRPSMSVVLGQVERFRKRATGVKSGWQKWALLAGASAIVIGGGLALLSRTPQRAEMDPYPTYVEARASALSHLRSQLASDADANRYSAIRQLVRGRDRSELASLRNIIHEGPRHSRTWQAAVAAVGVLADSAARPLLRELLQPEAVLAKKSCDFIRTDPLSRQQLLVASSLLMLQDQVALPVLRAYLRCYPQENPGLELDAALQLLWHDVPFGRTLTPSPQLMLRKVYSWQDESIEPLERTLLLQTDAELEDSIRWLRSQERLQKDDSLTIRRLLARLGDTQSEQSLVQLAQPSSARKWEAAASLLYSRPWDEALCSIVRDGLLSSQSAIQKRSLVTALARCPQLDTVRLLLARLRDTTQSLAFRDEVAGSLLQILPPAESQRGSTDDEIGTTCQSVFLTDRARCVDALLEKQDGSADEWLRKQWESSPPEIRLAVSQEIGRARLLRSIDVLRLALQDANTDVRLAGERAIVDILESVDRPEQHLSMALRNRLTELARSTDDSVRIIAQVILLRLGDSRGQNELLQALQHPSEKIRQLLVEVVPSQHPILIRALSDPSVVVRLFAAHRLAQSRDRRAIPVLREMLSGRGTQVLLAYMDLRLLGQKVDKPPNLLALLTTRDLQLRFAATQTLRYLPPQEAAPLLLQLVYDPADVIRKEVLRCASALYRIEKLPLLRLILDRFLNDEAPAVRLLAMRLRNELGIFAKPASVDKTNLNRLALGSVDGGSAPAEVGRVDAGTGATEAIPDMSKPVAGTVIRPDSPPTFEHSIGQVKSALRSRNLSTARQLLGQLRRRSGLSPSERSELEIVDAELCLQEYQTAGRTQTLLDEATRKVNALFERSRRAGFGDAQKQRLVTLYQLLKPLVVTIHIGAVRDGRCQEQGMILMPGVQQIDGKVWRAGSEVWRGCDSQKQ